MRTFDSKEFIKALKAKGFQLDRHSGDDIYYFYYEGKKTNIYTKVSQGAREDLGPALVKRIQSQLHLSKYQLVIDFAKCPMTHQQYIDSLKSGGLLH